MAILLMASSLAFAPPVLALPYDGTNPGATPCGDGSHPVTILDTAIIYSSAGARIGRVELRQSAYCATVWSRVYNESSSTFNLRETIILYSSPNVTGATSYPITDNSIPPGGSAWSKQYRDRPAFRAKGEIYQGGAWRSAQTNPSLMWSQREGNYADSPPTQPYTCGDAANPCVRWRTNSDGTPITLYYVNSSSLQQLPGDPYGDITFILGKYTALTGPAPNLAPSVGTYQISNYAYNDPNDNAYARSLSTAGSDHYFYTGYTKYNIAATFTAGRRGRVMSRHLVRLAALAAALVVVGCTRAGAPSAPAASAATASSASPDTSQSAAAASTATDCVTLYESIDSLDPTLENLRPVSKDVVVGTVTSEGAPFWNSPTGSGPKPGEKIGEGNEFYILTPYEVTVEQAVAGTRPLGQITVVVEGGQIGCDKFDVSPPVTLSDKTQYVLFLKPSLAADGTGAMKQPMAFLAFPVQADGTVATPLDGAVSIAKLSSSLTSGAQSTSP